MRHGHPAVDRATLAGHSEATGGASPSRSCGRPFRHGWTFLIGIRLMLFRIVMTGWRFMTISQRVGAYLEREGLLVRDIENPYLQLVAPDESAINDLLGHSITYRIAVGHHAGRKAFTLQTVRARKQDNDNPNLAKTAGFSLHVGVPANNRFGSTVTIGVDREMVRSRSLSCHSSAAVQQITADHDPTRRGRFRSVPPDVASVSISEWLSLRLQGTATGPRSRPSRDFFPKKQTRVRIRVSHISWIPAGKAPSYLKEQVCTSFAADPAGVGFQSLYRSRPNRRQCTESAARVFPA